MANIIIKKYNHDCGVNRALGVHIKDKSHYESEMARRGFVSDEEGNRLAEKRQSELEKPYRLSEKAEGIVKHLNQVRDKDGNVKVEGKLLAAMKEIGVPMEMPKHAPTGKLEGGF